MGLGNMATNFLVANLFVLFATFTNDRGYVAATIADTEFRNIDLARIGEALAPEKQS